LNQLISAVNAIMADSSSPSRPDCQSCKLVGAGGCFAGAVYAFYQRNTLPAANRNRQWLAIIGTGMYIFNM